MGDVETVIKDKKELYKYLSAFVMGDAGVYYSGKNCRLVTNSIEKEYILWKKDILENLTKVNYHVRIDKRTDYNRKPLHVLTTRTHPTYTKLRNRFYTDKYRGIDPHYLKLMDWETLSILFMDDGSCYQDPRCNATPSVNLNTKRLSYADTWLLKKGIKEKFGLEFNIQRQKHMYYLRLRSKDYYKFVAGVSPFILDCFQYKIL